MKTGHKIQLSFAGALLLMCALGGVAWFDTARMATRLRDVSNEKLPAVDAVLTLALTQANAGRQMTALMLRRLEGDHRTAARAGYRQAFEEMVKAEEAFEVVPHSAAVASAWADARGKLGQWQESIRRTAALLDERDALIAAGKGKDDPAVLAADARCWESFLATRALYAPSAAALVAASDLARSEAAESGAQGAAEVQRTAQAVVLMLAVGAALLLAIGWMLARNIDASLRALAGEAGALTEAVTTGRLDARGDPARLGQEFRPIVEGMNTTMDAFARPLAVTVEALGRISRGDLPPPITDRYEGDFNRIKDSLNGCIEALTGLIGEMTRMSGEHEAGDTDVQVDVARFAGVYRTVAEGVNEMVGAHLAVQRKAMGVFAEFGKGNFDATLEALPGKKAFINEAVEGVRGNLKRLIEEMNRMSGEHDRGDIDAAIDVGKFRGEFACMAQGVNDMVAGHIAVKKKAMACVAEFGRGNFEAPLERFPGKKAFINETVEQVRARLKALIADADGLASAAVAGRLDSRADAARHDGDFRKIVDGVNRTLDAVLAPIQEAAQVLERLARRDLRARVQGAYQGDHAHIKNSVNATAQALGEALVQVSTAVEQVSSAATQIASSSQAVASGASEQASSLTETSASVQSLADQTRHSAENARQANVLSLGARTAATDGAAAVEQLQGAMAKIKHSAEATSQIIKDVSEIAFQTNLLALNAAVEAARAGESGRGFAVVAEEVRSLAMRAKEAATKTEELIRQSVRQAVEGEVAAAQVSGKLGDILGGVSKVSDIVAEIAAAAGEQTRGIAQVTQAIGEMDRVTQQNAASAEESSSAASELSGQSEELAAMVGTFQLEATAGTDAPLRAAARRGGAALPGEARAALPPAPRKVNGPGPRRPAPAAEAAFPMGDEKGLAEF